MEEGRSLQDELLNDKKVLKQLEGVYNTSSDALQKKRVAKDINVMKKKIKSLEGKMVVLGVENEIIEEEDTGIGDDYDILSSIAVNRVREDSKDREIDAITSYIYQFSANII